MDIQGLLDVVNKARKSSAGNMTIGSMLSKLNSYNDDEAVFLSNEKYFDGSFDSYRSYYEDLYLGYDDTDKGFNTVDKLKKILNKALEQEIMTGYKGGDFPINTDTLVWLSSYGCCGDMIIDIQKINGTIVVITKEDEW